MLFESIMSSECYALVILPMLIFVARILDVTIGTIRIVFISKGHKILSPLLGFFEVLIWVLAISKIFEHLNNFAYYLAYAGGFAVGNYVGLLIEEKIAIGKVVIRIITRKSANSLINALHDESFGVTIVPAQGMEDNVHIIYTVLKRHDIDKVINMIKKYNPRSFYSIEDVRHVSQGIFPIEPLTPTRVSLNRIKRWRKGK